MQTMHSLTRQVSCRLRLWRGKKKVKSSDKATRSVPGQPADLGYNNRTWCKTMILLLWNFLYEVWRAIEVASRALQNQSSNSASFDSRLPWPLAILFCCYPCLQEKFKNCRLSVTICLICDFWYVTGIQWSWEMITGAYRQELHH